MSKKPKPAKYVVRKNTQLTSCQEYVYCKDEATANAVKARFEKERGSPMKYSWVDEAPHKQREHWGVTGDHPWVIAHTADVRPGQWYIGIWDTQTGAESVWYALLSGDDEVDDYNSGTGPIQDPGYVIVNAEDHANPVETWCYRSQLKEGECFEYLDEPGQAYFVCDQPGYVASIPETWLVSTSATSRDTKKWNAKVKRIPRWDDKRGPIILPCVDPLDGLRCLDTMSSEGLTGRECLARYEEAMQRGDLIGRIDGKQFVCLPPDKIGVVGGVIGGLTANQLELAKTAWSIKLGVLQEQQRRVDAQKAYENALACDDIDELPNMAYIDVLHPADTGD